MTRTESPFAFFLPILLITLIGPLALHLFTPTMPQVALYFDVDYEYIQWAFTLYLISVALGQLVCGCLCDHWRGRTMVISGLVLFAIGSGIAGTSQNPEQLFAARILQGVGGCVGMVVSRIVILERYDHREDQSHFGYIWVLIYAVKSISILAFIVMPEQTVIRAGLLPGKYSA